MARPSIFQPRDRVRQRAASGDTVGRLRSGYQMNDIPHALTEWRVTSGDPEVMDAVKDLFGGDEVQEWETKSEENLELFTDASEIDVILEDENAIDARMLVWPPSRGDKKFFVCGGEAHSSEKGGPYECTEGDYSNRREHDEQDHVCKPVIKIRFRLADNPDLGHFEFHTGSWSMAMDIGGEIGALEDAEGPVLATLALEHVSYEDAKGKKREFTKPVLTVGDALDDEDDD